MTQVQLRHRILAVCVALGLATQAAGQVTLSPGEMRELAGQAVMQGQPKLAFDLSNALIARDDADLNAHLIKSRAARDLGRNRDALTHARTAWSLAEEPDAQFAAAMATAQALSSSGRRTAAQLWLRRAVQIAPDGQAKTQAARDFRYVRSRNPWATALRFSVAPSSNINNGSRNETSELFDLPFEFELQGEARALSGVEVALGFSTRYRLVNTDRKSTDLLFGANHRTYTLSDEARDIAPDAEGADFATTTAFVGLRESYRLDDRRSRLGWDLRLGSTRYGGEDLLRYGRLGLSYQRAVGDRALVTATLNREVQDGLNGRADAAIWSGRLGYAFVLENRDRLSLSTTLTEAESDADFLDYTQRQVSIRYSLAQPVGPAQFEFGLTVGDKTHERSQFSSGGRDERSVEGTVTAALPEFDFYGFIPTVTLSAERTEANIDVYETENFGIQMGIRSAF